MDAAYGIADRDPVSLGDHILDLHPKVRKGTAEHGNGLFETLAAGSLFGDRVVVDEIGGDHLVSDGQVAFPEAGLLPVSPHELRPRNSESPNKR